MAQIDLTKTNIFLAPPTGMRAYGFDIDGKPCYVLENGDVVYLKDDTTEEIVQNIIANLGVGLAANRPDISTTTPGDIYVTSDTNLVYTVHDSISWDSTPLISNQFVSFGHLLYQYNGTSLVSIGLTETAQNIKGVKTFENFPVTPSLPPSNPYEVANKKFVEDSVIALWDDRGPFDASGGGYPASGGSGVAGAIMKGDVWTISVAGTIGAYNQLVRALVDNPGQTASNWYVSDNVGQDPQAIHRNIDSELTSLPEKITLAPGDLTIIEDSEDGFSKKKVTEQTRKDQIIATILEQSTLVGHIQNTDNRIINGFSQVTLPGVNYVLNMTGGNGTVLAINDVLIQSFRNEALSPGQYAPAFTSIGVWLWVGGEINISLYRGEGTSGELLLTRNYIRPVGNGSFFNILLPGQVISASPLEIFTIKMEDVSGTMGWAYYDSTYLYKAKKNNVEQLYTWRIYVAAANINIISPSGGQVNTTATGVEVKGLLKATDDNYEDLVLEDNDIPNRRFVINYVDAAVIGLWDDRGNYDASGNTFPTTGGSGTSGAILKGDIWTISIAGTLGGTSVIAGQTVRATIDTPGQTAGNWAISVGSSNTSFATQSEAETGTNEVKSMNPLRVLQSIVYQLASYSFSTLNTTSKFIIGAINELQLALSGKQNTLVSGTSIKTINSTSLLGSGDISINADVATSIHAATTLDIINDNDEFGRVDTVNGNALKKTSWLNIKQKIQAFLQATALTISEVWIFASTKLAIKGTGTKKIIIATSVTGDGADETATITKGGTVAMLDDIQENYATTTTAAGTTTLDVNSKKNQFFTGTTTQTIVMPVVSTLALGRNFRFVNDSTGLLTINSSGGNLIAKVSPGQILELACIAITGTDASSWDVNSETCYLMFAASDESTAITTGTAKITGHWAFNFHAISMFVGLTTTSSSGNPTFDFNDKDGNSIFSTRPAVVAGDLTSLANATQPVFATTTFIKGDKWSIDFDIAGTGAAGPKFYFAGKRY